VAGHQRWLLSQSTIASGPLATAHPALKSAPATPEPFSREEILMIVGLPLQELRHTRAVQEILEEGREAGRQQEAAALAIRLLGRRFGSLDQASRERLASLSLPRLEQLAEDLLDFSGPGDLQGWLAANMAD